MFNASPTVVPPLDGGRILVGLLPRALARPVARVEPYGFFIVVGLLVAGLVSAWWMRPILHTLLALMGAVLPSFPTVMGLSR